MKRPARRIRIDHLAAAVILAVMALIAFANILSRRLFHYSFAFTEEITINLFVWMTVVGTGLAFERGCQLGVVTLLNRFPRCARRHLAVIGALLSGILFVMLDVLLVQTVYREITFFKATSSALQLPIWIYYAGVVLVSPAVFVGVYRGLRRQLIALEEG